VSGATAETVAVDTGALGVLSGLGAGVGAAAGLLVPLYRAPWYFWASEMQDTWAIGR
jgi:hypothetical protein